MHNKYVIITPVKNEVQYIEYILHSVCEQSLKPHEWIIVNDGSSDKTVEIINKYLKSSPWIRLVNINSHHESRQAGAKVVKAFNEGLKYISHNKYDFIVKLDADLTLPENYFKRLSDEFANDPKAGLCGGKIVLAVGNKLIEEKAASYHLRGAIKAYRKECFEEIGGLTPVLGWDGIDEFTAMYHGWRVKIIRDLEVIHHRPTGNESGQLKISFKLGKSAYQMGYDPLLALLRAIKRGLAKPYVIPGLIFYLGYVIALLKKEPKIVPREIENFIKKFQYQRIFSLRK